MTNCPFGFPRLPQKKAFNVPVIQTIDLL